MKMVKYKNKSETLGVQPIDFLVKAFSENFHLVLFGMEIIMQMYTFQSRMIWQLSLCICMQMYDICIKHFYPSINNFLCPLIRQNLSRMKNSQSQ